MSKKHSTKVDNNFPLSWTAILGSTKGLFTIGLSLVSALCGAAFYVGRTYERMEANGHIIELQNKYLEINDAYNAEIRELQKQLYELQKENILFKNELVERDKK